MAVDKRLLEALQSRFNLGTRQVNRKITEEANRLALPRDLAAVSLAMDLKMSVQRFVDAAGLATIRGARAAASPPPQAPTSSGTESSRTSRSRRAAPVSAKRIVFSVAGIDYSDVPGLMVGLANDAKRAAGDAYPFLYLFENSMRELIRRILSREYGDSWWSKVLPTIQAKAKENQERELKEKWHSARGAEPIQYVDLVDLATIVVSRSLWKHFAPLFPRKEFVTSLVHDFNVSRRIVAHMNAVPAGEVPAIQAAFRKWVLQLKAGEAHIP
jgi:hypothetical protein